MRSLVLLVLLASIASAERLRVKAKTTLIFDGFAQLVPRLTMKSDFAYRKNWIGHVTIELDAFAGIYPDDFEIVLDVEGPGTIIKARVAKIALHDTSAIDGLESVTIDATIATGQLASEGCVEVRATILPIDATTNVVPLCLTSLPRTARRAGGKRIRTMAAYHAMNDVIFVGVPQGTSLDVLRRMETAARGKLQLEGRLDGTTFLVMHLQPHARDGRDLSRRQAALMQFPEATVVDLDHVK